MEGLKRFTPPPPTPSRGNVYLKNLIWFRAAWFTLQQLRTRIASIPMKDRPIPDTDNLKILGVELKIRLAATSDVITEHGRRGGKVRVFTATVQNRFVPLWDIDKQQDPRLLCKVKVKVNHVRRRRFKWRT